MISFARPALIFSLQVGIWLAIIYSPSASAETTLSAREHYDKGLALVGTGDLATAAREFETAYRISPNDIVLYNLGQAYLQLGNPVGAEQAFQKYLNGVPNLTPDRQREVKSLIAICGRRIGRLSLDVEPSGSEVVIDGQSFGRSPISESISLSAGRHGVTIEGNGLLPYIGQVDIEPEKDVTVRARLEAPPVSPRETTPQFGQLVLECALPSVQAFVDSVPVAPHAAVPLSVGIGAHQISWRRDEYESYTLELNVTDGRAVHAECDMRARTDLTARELGILTLSIDTPRAQARVDGRPTSTTLRLPRGKHWVVVRRPGYLDWSQTINVEAGFLNVTRVQLRPNAERAAALGRAKTRRNWAYIAGGAGLALLGGGVALYAQNGHRYDRWRTERDELSQAFQNNSDASVLLQRSSAVRDQAVSIQQRDDLALGVSALGLGLLSYAAISWLTAEP